jgi:hypothetical protein
MVSETSGRGLEKPFLMKTLVVKFARSWSFCAGAQGRSRGIQAGSGEVLGTQGELGFQNRHLRALGTVPGNTSDENACCQGWSFLVVLWRCAGSVQEL